MTYRIKYSYNTGDSFKSNDNIIEILDESWTNLDIAKENLERIKRAL